MIFSCIDGVHLNYDGYQYPAWSEGIGWLLAAIVMAQVPVWALVAIYHSVGSCQALCWVIRGPANVVALNLRDVISPSSNWGPALECNRHRTYQSARGYRWVYFIPRLLGFWPAQTHIAHIAQGSTVSSIVSGVDNEGHRFVTETSFYNLPDTGSALNNYW